MKLPSFDKKVHIILQCFCTIKDTRLVPGAEFIFVIVPMSKVYSFAFFRDKKSGHIIIIIIKSLFRIQDT